MKKIIILLLIIGNLSSAQKNDVPLDLKFDTQFYDAKDQWVVIPKKDTDSTYLYGFVYLDDMAGFTFNVESTFHVDNSGKFISKTADKTSFIKHRLEKNTVKMAVLSTKRQKELGLPKEPDWLKIYNKYDSEVEQLTRCGFHLNALDACESALIPLLKANKIDSNFKGLAFEIAYAYNHLGQFEKAVPVLEKVIKNSNDEMLYKELGYAYINSKKFIDAENIYKKGIKISKSDAIKGEMAINMTNAYFIERNRIKFDEWANITRQYSKQNPTFLKYLDHFEKNWNTKK